MSQTQDFFETIINTNITKSTYKEKTSIIVVAHIIPDMEDFLAFLSKYFNLKYIIPKPNSINKNIYKKIETKYDIRHITREEIKNNRIDIIEKLNREIKNDFIIIDIWWYFSSVSWEIEEKIWNKFLWIIEDTENWLQKYEKKWVNSFPFISVARSILKEAEDYLVWESIVFATEYILRSYNQLLRNKHAVVIWFWKIGRSISRSLHGKNISLSIYDYNPYKWIEALTYWYNFSKDKCLLYSADIIFCATWNFALKWEDFLKLKNGCILASVTSSDDELDIQFLEKHFKKYEINSHISQYTKENKNILLLNKWNAVNFVTPTWVGDFIRLLQAEIIHAICHLIKNNKRQRWQINIDNNEKKYIAENRLKFFY